MIQRRLTNQLVWFKRSHMTSVLMMLCCGCRHRRIFCSSRRRFLCHRMNADANGSIALMESAHILWDYLRIDDQLEKSDLILILGNSDLRTADYAAQLYHDGFAPVVAVSGKEGHGTKGKWEAPEAIIFSRHLLQLGVPSSNIIMETEATNTGENVRFTQQLLRSQQLQHAVDHPKIVDPSSLILVQTPFMGRRVYTTFMKQWEKADSVSVKVTSPPIPLSEYADEEAGYNTLMDVVAEMVRNMRRVLCYPTLGFQIKQQVPSNVLEAFSFLQNFLKDNRSLRDL